MTDWIVRNRETGRIESNVVDEQRAREYALQANISHQTDAYYATPWEDRAATRD